MATFKRKAVQIDLSEFFDNDKTAYINIKRMTKAELNLLRTLEVGKYQDNKSLKNFSKLIKEDEELKKALETGKIDQSKALELFGNEEIQLEELQKYDPVDQKYLIENFINKEHEIHDPEGNKLNLNDFSVWEEINAEIPGILEYVCSKIKEESGSGLGKQSSKK